MRKTELFVLFELNMLPFAQQKSIGQTFRYLPLGESFSWITQVRSTRCGNTEFIPVNHKRNQQHKD